MKITLTNGIRFIEPDEGKILTNGDTYSDGVYLAINANVDEWVEVDYQPESGEETGEETNDENNLQTAVKADTEVETKTEDI